MNELNSTVDTVCFAAMLLLSAVVGGIITRIVCEQMHEFQQMRVENAGLIARNIKLQAELEKLKEGKS